MNMRLMLYSQLLNKALWELLETVMSTLSKDRPDLSNRSIITLLVATVIVCALIVMMPVSNGPGSSLGQTAATLGALCLLAPVLFSVMKRSGMSASPPTWFVAHVLSTLIGVCLTFVHVRSGDWLTPPGLVLLLLVFLVLQGSVIRVVVSRGFSLLFARNSTRQGFGAWQGEKKQAIQSIIQQKTELLKSIDCEAQEALFSPALKHWLRHPLLCTQYQRLADKEAALVGARQAAGRVLAWSRRVHILAGVMFYFGLMAHLIVVLFFAGYAADGEVIHWWYITDWGKSS